MNRHVSASSGPLYVHAARLILYSHNKGFFSLLLQCSLYVMKDTSVKRDFMVWAYDCTRRLNSQASKVSVGSLPASQHLSLSDFMKLQFTRESSSHHIFLRADWFSRRTSLSYLKIGFVKSFKCLTCSLQMTSVWRNIFILTRLTSWQLIWMWPNSKKFVAGHQEMYLKYYSDDKVSVAVNILSSLLFFPYILYITAFTTLSCCFSI